MTDLFLKILNLSFSATWVVLAVVLARLLLKKAPRRLVCALWALVALRLVFGGIEAPFSLIPSSEIITPESLYDQSPSIQSGIDSIDDLVNPVYSESLRPSPGASINPLQVWLAVAANLWLLGIVGMTLWAAVSVLRVRRQTREAVPEGDVWLCDRIGSPFIFGLFRPRIYLPSGLPEASRAHVIAHEQAHLCRRDHWWKPLGFALLTVNWFNPALWLGYILLCRDIELACDERVIRGFNGEEKKSYSAALLRCAVNPRPIAACPLAFGEVGVKQRVKSVLHYKKSAFWIILLALILTAVLAVGLLTDPLSPPAEIRYQGELYIENGRPVEEVPDKQESTGTLRSVLHDTTRHPNEDGQAVNLDCEYAGQPLVQVGNALYLQNPGGEGWMRFVRLHSPGNVLALLQRHNVQIDLSLEGDTVSIREFVQDYTQRDFGLRLNEILADVTMEPTLEWDQSMLAINYAENISLVISPKDYSDQCLLTRRENDWLAVYRDEDWAITAWIFQCPELDALLAPWQEELAFATERFGSFASEDSPIYPEYQTMKMEDISIRLCIPGASFGSDYTENHWQYEGHASYTDQTITVRCRPYGREDWMEICYYNSEDTLYFYFKGIQDTPITLSGGITGTLYHSGDPSRWNALRLDTTRGQLIAYTPENVYADTDWTESDYQMALAIVKTLSLTENGTSLLGDPNPLGITLRLENITPTGATLVCTQDGTAWDEITTGEVWNLQRYEDGLWFSLMPESTVWTTIAYVLTPGSETRWNLNWSELAGSLEPGRYRVSKAFTGERNPPFTLGIEGETVTKTLYAEFEIE